MGGDLQRGPPDSQEIPDYLTQFDIYSLRFSDFSPAANKVLRGLKEQQIREKYVERYGIASFLAGKPIQSWFSFCQFSKSKKLYQGVFLDSDCGQGIVDEILSCYMLWVKDPKTNPWGEALPFTMARPLLCAVIAWNATFGRLKVQGTAAWKIVYEYEKKHIRGEPVRISQEDFAGLFRDLASLFTSLDPPFRMDKKGRVQYWDAAGILVIVLTSVLLYRAGNLLDKKVALLIHEAPLEELITFHPNTKEPTHIVFFTREKTDKSKGLSVPARPVRWPCKEGWCVLDPKAVIDNYLKAHGMNRETMQGPIQKPAGRGRHFSMNSFTQANYRSWLNKLVTRKVISLPSIRGEKFNPGVVRRTSLSYYAEVVSDIHKVQALAGHANVATTADIYIGVEEGNLASLRASSAYSLLGLIQASVLCR